MDTSTDWTFEITWVECEWERKFEREREREKDTHNLLHVTSLHVFLWHIPMAVVNQSIGYEVDF